MRIDGGTCVLNIIFVLFILEARGQVFNVSAGFHLDVPGLLGGSPAEAPSVSKGDPVTAPNNFPVTPLELIQLTNVPAKYLKPQDPYASLTLNTLKPAGICQQPTAAQLQTLWSGAGGQGAPPASFASDYNATVQAVIWAYPMVSMGASFPSVDLALQPMTLPPEAYPQNLSFAINTYNGLSFLANSSINQIVAPNSDTLYSAAYIDLTEGPVSINVPISIGRYFLISFIDAYSNVPIVTGPTLDLDTSKRNSLALIPPKYAGPAIPAKYNHTYNFTTPLGLTFVRIFTQAGNATDLAIAQALQKGITVSKIFANQSDPTKGHDLAFTGAVSAVNSYTFDKSQALRNLSAFWTFGGDVLALNAPPTPYEVALLNTLGPIGLTSTGFNASGLSDSTMVALNVGLAAGLHCIAESSNLPPKTTRTKWASSGNLIGDGLYGASNSTPPNLLDRSIFAFTVLLGLPSTSTLYYTTLTAFDPALPLEGQPNIPLDGSLYNYTLTFPSFPNVTGFWSVTMYTNPEFLFFGDNPYNATTNFFRYNINRNADTFGGLGTIGFNFNAGKNYTIYISTTQPPPGSPEYSNWLPIGFKPSSKFALYLRLYGPPQEAVKGLYEPPPVFIHKGTFS